MGRDTDRLRIISMNGSGGRGRQHWELRRPHIDGLIGNQQPDVMFLPGDDPGPETMVIPNYSQLFEPSHNGTVLLYDPSRLQVKHNHQGWLSIPGLDTSKVVFPSVDIMSPAPSRSVVKKFQMITWHWELMETSSNEIYQNGERLMLLSEMMAQITETEILIGGDFNLPIDQIERLIKWLNNLVSQGIESLMPHFRDMGYMDEMTRYVTSPQRRLRQLTLHKCKIGTQTSTENYFIASKEMQLMKTKTLELERLRAHSAVIRTEALPTCTTAALPREPRPTQTKWVTPPREHINTTTYVPPPPCYSSTQMYIPQRPPKHHGG